jgi:hypothetical protein
MNFKLSSGSGGGRREREEKPFMPLNHRPYIYKGPSAAECKGVKLFYEGPLYQTEVKGSPWPSDIAEFYRGKMKSGPEEAAWMKAIGTFRCCECKSQHEGWFAVYVHEGKPFLTCEFCTFGAGTADWPEHLKEHGGRTIYQNLTARGGWMKEENDLPFYFKLIAANFLAETAAMNPEETESLYQSAVSFVAVCWLHSATRSDLAAEICSGSSAPLEEDLAKHRIKIWGASPRQNHESQSLVWAQGHREEDAGEQGERSSGRSR